MSRRRTIGVVTVDRSDYGIYRPLLQRIAADRDLRLWIFAGGSHLERKLGITVRMIEADGFEIREYVPMRVGDDSPKGIANSMGEGVKGFAAAFLRSRPDMLVLLGDRFDMLPAAVAALPFVIPLAHLHGGEATEGLIDDAIRHSISKMSHLHFVSTALYRDRLIRMGEEPWRVTVSGAPSLDSLRTLAITGRQELEERLDISLATPPLLVTFHPVTLEHQDTKRHMSEFMAALERVNMPVIFTRPNADTGGHIVNRAIEDFLSRQKTSRFVSNLGTAAYFGLMQLAAAMAGNSSSGIIEAASFALPVVNIGNRQRGRYHGVNVLDVPCESVAIEKAIRRATSASFKRKVAHMKNPYGDGEAATRIVRVLKTAALGRGLIAKPFFDGTIKD